MKTNIIYLIMIFGSFLPKNIFCQNRDQEKSDPNYFNEYEAKKIAKEKGISANDINGYVQFLKNDFSSKRALEKNKANHPHINNSQDIQETVIYLSPNQPQSLGCPNMGFEQYNFNGWIGGKGTVSIGSAGGNPIYTSTGVNIYNNAGNNVSVLNTANYHTLMTIPPTNNSYPFCIGYDSLAVRTVGGNQISDIPFLSPFSFDPVSVRLNSANGNYRASRLKYITTTSSTNKRLSFSYAVILNDPTSHTPEESPYFKVEVKNETTGAILPGCSSYTFNPKTASASDSLQVSDIEINFDVVKYRKWKYYSVDLSSLPSGTSVSINFEVGGCTQSGHAGYAYVDAECGGIGKTYANMCSGSNYATLVAPTGFSSYQWVDASGILTGEINDTLIVNPATVGSTYTVNMVSPGGCVISQTVSITLTTVNIINLNSTSSCFGGNSGTAIVEASGSNGIYTYSWTNTSNGTVVSNNQSAVNLPTGTYSVLVSSTGCGQASANLSVGVSPQFFVSIPKTFCGNATYIAQPGGSNYSWYYNNTLLQLANGLNDTLKINNPTSGDIYTVVYNNNLGCRDSIKYTLSSIPGGSMSFLTNNVCPGNVDGTSIITINSPNPGPYNFHIQNPVTGAVIKDTTSTSTSFTISSLPASNYFVQTSDGLCIYNDTLTIKPIETNFTLTAVNETLCFPQEAKINLTFDNSVPINCGADPVMCNGPQVQLFNSGPFSYNTDSDYPTPFSGWWYSAKQQFLITAADLNNAGITAGRISSLSFNVTALNGGPTTYPDYEIKMGCTSLTSMPTGGSQAFATGLTSVYYNANQPVSLGWLTHTFSQSYVWDGLSNLIVEVCTSPLSSFSSNASIELKQMAYTSNMKFISTSSSVNACSNNNSNSSGVYMTNGSKMLPNMKFGFCSLVYTPVNTYSLQISSNGTIVTNYSNDSIRVQPTFTSPPTGNGSVIYSLTVTNPIGGCVETKTVEVFYPPLNTTIATNSNTDICNGNSVTLSATGASNYNWYSLQNGILTSIASSSNTIVTPTNIGTNSYVVTGTISCPGSIPDSKTVTVNVKPQANLVISNLLNTSKCINQPIILNPTITSTVALNSGAPYSYSWTTIPGNIPASGVNDASTYTVTSNTTSSLALTVSGFCSNTVTSNVVVSNFIDDLSVSISNSTTICPKAPFTVSAITNGGRPAYNYNWYIEPNSNSLSNSANLSTTSPESEGTYTITVYATDSCGYQKLGSELLIVSPPCMVTIPNVITPNGDNHNDYFKIENIEHHPNTSLTIFDRWGKKVYENPNYNNEWKADDASDGTYFYVIEVVDDKKYSGFITVFKGK
jgi:gliding motility-associated-like protein